MTKTRKRKKKASKHGMGDQLGGGDNEQAALQSGDWAGSKQDELQAKVLELRRLQAQVAAKLRQAEARRQVACARAALQSALSELACADAHFETQKLTNGLGAGFSSDGRSNKDAYFNTQKMTTTFNEQQLTKGDCCGSSDNSSASVHGVGTGSRGKFGTQKLPNDGLSVRGGTSASGDLCRRGKGRGEGVCSDSCQMDPYNAQNRTKAGVSADELGIVGHLSGASSDESHGDSNTNDLSTSEGSVSSDGTSVCGVGDCCGSLDNSDASVSGIGTNGRYCGSLDNRDEDSADGFTSVGKCKLVPSVGSAACEQSAAPDGDKAVCGTGNSSLAWDGVSVSSMSVSLGAEGSGMVDHPSGGSDSEGHDSSSTHDLSTDGGSVSSGHTSVCGVGECCGSPDNGVASDKCNEQKLTKGDTNVCSGHFDAQNVTNGGLSVSGDMGASKGLGVGGTCMSKGLGSRSASTINRFTRRLPRGNGAQSVGGEGLGVMDHFDALSMAQSATGDVSVVLGESVCEGSREEAWESSPATGPVGGISEDNFSAQGFSNLGMGLGGELANSERERGGNSEGLCTGNDSSNGLCNKDPSDAQHMTSDGLCSGCQGSDWKDAQGSLSVREEASFEGDLSESDELNKQNMAKQDVSEREAFKEACQKWLTDKFGQGDLGGRGGLSGGVNMFNTQDLNNVGVSVRDGAHDMRSVMATARLLGLQHARSLRLEEKERFNAQSLHKNGLCGDGGCETVASGAGDSCGVESKVMRRARLIAARALGESDDALSSNALSSSKPLRHPDQLDSQGVNSSGYP